MEKDILREFVEQQENLMHLNKCVAFILKSMKKRNRVRKNIINVSYVTPIDFDEITMISYVNLVYASLKDYYKVCRKHDPCIIDAKKHLMEISPDLDVCFCPGIMFDCQGNRLGRGKGFYDRYLRNKPNLLKIGVCLEDRLLPYGETIKVQKHDVKMDAILTNRSFTICS